MFVFGVKFLLFEQCDPNAIAGIHGPRPVDLGPSGSVLVLRTDS